MPWKASSPVEQKFQFVMECKKGEASMTALCRTFGISRQTGYKWLARYYENGPAGRPRESRGPAEARDEASQRDRQRRHSSDSLATTEVPALGAQEASGRVKEAAARDSLAGSEHDRGGAQAARTGEASASTAAHTALYAALRYGDGAEPALVRRLQGPLLHGRRAEGLPADDHRRTQPVHPALRDRR